MKLLFVCNQGLYRSATAAELWKKHNPDDEAKHAGVYSGENIKPLLSWAEKIFVMEELQRREILKIDSSLSTYNKIEILEIQDIYNKNDPELIRILKEKLNLPG